MKLIHRFLIFCYGLFTIAAQSLLFREFITSFEGNDISVGIFFASWFLWIGLSALLAYKVNTLTEKLVKNIEFLFLAYLPAFFLQMMLIVHIRSISGIEHYALLSIRSILLLSILANAPVSIITGLLFPTACRWFKKYEESAISNVYILEAAGSFIGGLGVTILLAAGLSSVRIFLILGFIVSSAVLMAELTEKKLFIQGKSYQQYIRWFFRTIKVSTPLCMIFFFLFGFDNFLTRQIQIEKWTRLLPRETFTGSFQTAQAEYLYGTYRGQWIVVREGSVTEAIPDDETNGRNAAISLCQNPEAKKILVIGSGLGVCQQFLKIPDIQKVSWAYCDTEYIKKINDILPKHLRVTDSRLNLVTEDVRSYLAKNSSTFDIIILNLPDATSSVMNRYYTLQFYQQLKQSLRTGGVLSIRISGGENIMGTELVTLGASTKMTLQKVFSNIILVPGVETWFIASESKTIRGSPGVLADRFRKIEKADEVFVPDALLSIYLPDRAEKAMEAYSNPDLPATALINSDSRPLTYLYSLLFAAKQSGAPVINFVKRLIKSGPLPLFIPIFVFIVLRFIFLISQGKSQRIGKVTSEDESVLPASLAFDGSFLTFSSGLLSIAVVIILMYLYQTRFGSLYLYIGIISSVFMLGLSFGASIIRYLLSKSRIKEPQLLLSVILIHSAILSAIAFGPFEQWTRSATSDASANIFFVTLFFLCGVCSGCYFPIAAKQLDDAGFETGQSGSRLETSDHIGACAGGLVTSLVLVPVLGTALSFLVLIALLAANLPALAIRMLKPLKIYPTIRPATILQKIGLSLFGIGATVIICSNLIYYFGMSLGPVLPEQTAKALAGGLQVKSAKVKFDDSIITYYKVFDENGSTKGYIFTSDDFAGRIRGFGGPIDLAVFVDTSGSLINFNVIKSNETPSYLKLVTDRQNRFLGTSLFSEKPFADVQAVTGATISSKAIISALELSGGKFAAKILKQPLKSETSFKFVRGKFFPDITGIYLISALIFSIILIYYGSFLIRVIFLILTFVIGGLFLNAQYSTEQIATILSLQSPAAGLSAVFLMAIGIPLIVLLFGNIYCGYICPFGAAQELVSYLRPAKLRLIPDKETMRKASFVKYVILFIFITVFFLSRNHIILSADPLVSVFSNNTNKLMLWTALIAIVGSFFYPRFWCLYLCPAGAFLSLLKRLSLLRRYLPAKKFGLCEFGITGKNQMDCICCDRCLHRSKKDPESQAADKLATPSSRKYFITAVAAAAIFVSAVTINKFLKTIPAGFTKAEKGMVSGSGQTRNVDEEQIHKMIKEKKLSDKEAEYYKKVE